MTGFVWTFEISHFSPNRRVTRYFEHIAILNFTVFLVAVLGSTRGPRGYIASHSHIDASSEVNLLSENRKRLQIACIQKGVVALAKCTAARRCSLGGRALPASRARKPRNIDLRCETPGTAAHPLELLNPATTSAEPAPPQARRSAVIANMPHCPHTNAKSIAARIHPAGASALSPTAKDQQMLRGKKEPINPPAMLGHPIASTPSSSASLTRDSVRRPCATPWALPSRTVS